MKDHYAGREAEMPYKTLGSFRRARRADNLSPAYKAWQNRKMDTNTFTRWQKVKDFRNCPKTLEELQEIKYNKNTENWTLLKRERRFPISMTRIGQIIFEAKQSILIMNSGNTV